MRCPTLLLASLIGLLTVIAGFTGCQNRSTGSSGGDGVASEKPVKIDIQFPEGDATVTAELGGPGFDGEGWTTSDPGPLGDPKAAKGGVISSNIPSWPENLRRFGTGSNTWLNYVIRGLCFESLCSTHPVTLETIPNLATHWKIFNDNMTFQFRINPKAYWSNGRPVVADDWVATYRLLNDDTLIAPMMKETICNMMEEPKALSKYMLEVKCKEKNWRNFLAIAELTPLPTHELEGISGGDFLKKYNFRFTATTGPYIVHQKDVKKGESLTLTRRGDYWAADADANVGLYNFNKIRFVVVRDRRLAFEKACKGEIDFYPVYTAKWWIEDIKPLDAYKNGQLIRTEIFTRFPKGYQGMAFNMRSAPLDDIRVRKALAHLYDRKTMLTKFAYDQYDRLKSYYPGSDAENTQNEMIEFDPQRAISLLADAGWTERDVDGVLTKDGNRLSITIMYRSQSFEKYLTSYQEACRQAGVEVKLNLVTPETHWKNMQERSFQVAGMAWGASLYPNPKTSWSSDMAGKPGSNNITGLQSEIADGIIEQYDSEFDMAKRTELLKQLDAELYKHVPYSLEWYNPCERILYWNKFGMPDYSLPRYGEYESAFSYWWYDAEKAKSLKETRQSGQQMRPIPELQLRPWVDAPEA